MAQVGSAGFELDFVVHRRKAGKDLMMYPHAKETKIRRVKRENGSRKLDSSSRVAAARAIKVNLPSRGTARTGS